MQYDKTTGTFVIGTKAVCRGFYGTETHKMKSVDLTPPANAPWTVTEAKNGTGLRLFSLPRSTYEEDYEPLHQTLDRLWFLATYKNLGGHDGHWKEGGELTFGQMFKDCLGEDGVAEALEATSGDLCISYFVRHRDNDIHNEMGDEESHVIQTTVWDSAAQEFIGPSMPNWPEPTLNVRNPTLLFKSEGELSNEPHHGPFFSAGETVTIEEGHPLLLTVYNGGLIHSYKLIAPADEYLRQFRSRSHSRFVALMIARQLVKDGKVEAEELACAEERLFTPEELAGFEVNLQAGKDEFFAELRSKYNGNYVNFHRDLFKWCRLRESLDNHKKLLNYDSTDQEVEENLQSHLKEVFDNLLKCTTWRKVCALEAFWRVYVRQSFN